MTIKRTVCDLRDIGRDWRQAIIRAAGLDPDGRCVPMLPARNQVEQAIDVGSIFVERPSDAALLRALYQPAKPWW